MRGRFHTRRLTVAGVDKQTITAHLLNAGLKRDAGPGRRFFKKKGENFMLEDLRTTPLLSQLLLKCDCIADQLVVDPRGQIRGVNEVADVVTSEIQ